MTRYFVELACTVRMAGREQQELEEHALEVMDALTEESGAIIRTF